MFSGEPEICRLSLFFSTGSWFFLPEDFLFELFIDELSPGLDLRQFAYVDKLFLGLSDLKIEDVGFEAWVIEEVPSASLIRSSETW